MAKDIVKRLTRLAKDGHGWDQDRSLLDEAAQEILKLRIERDEARRQLREGAAMLNERATHSAIIPHN